MFKKINFSLESKILNSYKTGYKFDFLLSNNEPINEINYTPTKTIIFEDGKYLVLKTNTEIYNTNYKSRIRALNVITCSLSVLNVYYLFTFQYNLNLYLFLLIYTQLFKKREKDELKLIIDEIYLLKDGKSIQIVTYSKDTLTYDIKEVRKLKHKELILFYSICTYKDTRMFPIMIGRKIFLVNPKFYDVELFPVICNSAYIKIPDEKYNVISI